MLDTSFIDGFIDIMNLWSIIRIINGNITQQKKQNTTEEIV